MGLMKASDRLNHDHLVTKFHAYGFDLTGSLNKKLEISSWLNCFKIIHRAQFLDQKKLNKKVEISSWLNCFKIVHRAQFLDQIQLCFFFACDKVLQTWGRVAQWVQHYIQNCKVLGSNPIMCLVGFWDLISSRGSQWPLGQIK